MIIILVKNAYNLSTILYNKKKLKKRNELKKVNNLSSKNIIIL